MGIVFRLIAAVPGLLLLLVGINWIRDPATAAQELGMSLPDGVARSTMIGDIGAFFLATSTFVLLGAVIGRARWLWAGALLLGLAGIMRTLAWALHGAPFALEFIGVEVVMTTVLIFIATRLK